MKVVPMTDAHILAIAPQPQQAAMSPAERLETAASLRARGSAYAVVDDEAVLMLGGVQEVWPGRGMAWVLLSDVSGRRLVRLTRMVRRYLDALDFRRVELYVDAQFAAGSRWASMLGFVNETPDGMAGFLPAGNRAYMFGRVR